MVVYIASLDNRCTWGWTVHNNIKPNVTPFWLPTKLSPTTQHASMLHWTGTVTTSTCPSFVVWTFPSVIQCVVYCIALLRFMFSVSILSFALFQYWNYLGTIPTTRPSIATLDITFRRAPSDEVRNATAADVVKHIYTTNLNNRVTQFRLPSKFTTTTTNPLVPIEPWIVFRGVIFATTVSDTTSSDRRRCRIIIINNVVAVVTTVWQLTDVCLDLSGYMSKLSLRNPTTMTKKCYGEEKNSIWKNYAAWDVKIDRKPSNISLQSNYGSVVMALKFHRLIKICTLHHHQKNSTNTNLMFYYLLRSVKLSCGHKTVSLITLTSIVSLLGTWLGWISSTFSQRPSFKSTKRFLCNNNCWRMTRHVAEASEVTSSTTIWQQSGTKWWGPKNDNNETNDNDAPVMKVRKKVMCNDTFGLIHFA